MKAYPSTCGTLVLSDVINDPLDIIASGPSVPDVHDWNDVRNLVKISGLQLPPAVVQLLEEGEKIDNTKLHPIFTDHTPNGTGKLSETIIVGNNALAVKAAAKKAQSLGYNSVILGTSIEGAHINFSDVCASNFFLLKHSI